MPPITATVAAVGAVVKQRYPSGLPKDLITRGHALLAKLTFRPDQTGDPIKIPVQVDDPQGRSASFATLFGANSGIAPSTYRAFLVSLASDYAGHFIDDKSAMQMKNDQGAFVRLVEKETNGMLRQLGNSLGHAIYRDGTGVKATVASHAAGVITLTRPQDVKYFGIGEQLNLIRAGAIVNGPSFDTTILRVDKTSIQAGTITVTVIGTAATPTAADQLATHGDFDATGNSKIRGLAAINPLVAPVGGDNFWGVDRSVQVEKLAGFRLTDPNVNLEDQLFIAGMQMKSVGSTGELVAFASYDQVGKVMRRANGRLVYKEEYLGGTLKYGYKYAEIESPAGTIKLYPDSDAPEDRFHAFAMEAVELGHLGEVPHIVATDGLSSLRRPTADAVEIRGRYYAQMLPLAPGLMVTGQLA